MPDPTSLNDLINDAPTDLLEADGTKTETKETEEEKEDKELDEEIEEEEKEEETEEEEEKEEESEEEEKTEEEEDEDYVTKADLDEEEKPAAPATVNAGEEESKYVLERLQKIPVRIINGKDKEETVEVYGYGDLPRDYKGIATPYEAGLFQTAVTNLLNRVSQLQNEYRQTQNQKLTDDYNKRENRTIAEDLQTLRREGLFPHFKGAPGTREFDESEGAKEFDKVVAFMNERNEEYGRQANSGRAYKHIGFYEAYELLHPGQREAETKENKARRGVARKLKSAQGSPAEKGPIKTTPVTNLQDLQEEFNIFAGAK